MKRVGKFYLCLAGGLVLNAGLRAVEPVSAENPYTPIVARNVFGINPPPPDLTKQQPAEPLPKITPNGIVSVFGHPQALFKVAFPAKPGQPAKDLSYMLSEGQAQDDIEVTKIDEKGGLVTFNNHGTVQELPLANVAASGPSGPAPGGPGPGAGPGPKPGFPRPGVAPGGGGVNNPGFIRFGQSGGFGAQNQNNNAGNNANNAGAKSGSRLGVALGGAGGFSGQQTGQQRQNLSADDQAVIIAANQAIAESKGDPIAKIYPPTDYTTAAGATPNTAPPPATGGSTSP